jgi:ABC-type branched-subunit amino acid transport system substrate-binding protein
MTGPAQKWGIEYHRGIGLAFADYNARIGPGRPRLELLLADDQYEPSLARQNTSDLIESEKVFGLIGYVGAECSLSGLAQATKAGIPFVAPLSGDEGLRASPDRWLVNMRPGDDAETRVLASALVTINFHRVSVLVQADADGQAALQSLGRSLAATGRPPPISVVKIDRNSTGQVESAGKDIEAAMRELLRGNPDAVICLSSFATTGAVVSRLRSAGYAGGCYATSMSSSAAIISALGNFAAGLSMTQVVPSPFVLSMPLVASYRKALEGGEAVGPEYVSLEGWIAGRMVAEALLRLGANSVTRESFMTSIEALGGTSLDGLPMHWDASRREFRSRVTLSVLDRNGRPMS